MTAIQRFALHGTIMNPHSSGPYVRHEDHLAAMQGRCLAQIKEPAGAAPAAVARPAWDKTRDSLATLLLGLARRPFLDFDVACIALDAATEPGMPLAYLRGAQAAPALEAPAAPKTASLRAALDMFPIDIAGQSFTVFGVNNGKKLEADGDDTFFSKKKVIAFLTQLKGHLDALAAAPQEPAAASADEREEKLAPPMSPSEYLDHLLAAPAAPSGLPSGWVPCILTHDGQHPEEVAYGPQIMMDRLKKWLGRYFELLAQKVLDEPVHAEMLAALRAVAMDVVYVGTGENTISDSARAKVEAVLEKIGAPWPGPAAAPAAPAVDATDTARLDWIFQQADEFTSYILRDQPGDGLYRVTGMGAAAGEAETPREALDAARAAQAKEGGAA